VPDLKAWQAAYAAFMECVGEDPGPIQRSIAWAAAMNAVMAYIREMNSRGGDG
jgi:hypothetical protein